MTYSTDRFTTRRPVLRCGGGSTRIAVLCAALLALAARVMVFAGHPISLFVVEDQGVDRHGEVASGGIPFVQGAVSNPDRIVVRDAAGKPLPVQAHQLGIAWPDGSLKWALVQFPVDVPANTTARFDLDVRRGSRPTPPAAVAVHEFPDHVEVSTGPMIFTVSRDDLRLPNQVWIRGETRLAQGARLELVADREHLTADEFSAMKRDPYTLSTFGLADKGGIMWNSKDNTFGRAEIKWNRITPGIDYSRFLGGKANITVEERGPVRCVLRIETAAEKKEGELGLVARLYAYAGQPLIRVEMTLENYERVIPIAVQPYAVAIVNVKHIRRFRYALAPVARADRVVMGGGEYPTDRNCRLSQLRSDAWTLRDQDGKVLHDGTRYNSGIMAANGDKSVSVANKYFWEVFPKALGYDAGRGELAVDLWPDEADSTGYPLAGGRARTYEFVVAFDTPMAEVGAMAHAELRPYPAPDYVAGTGATHRFVPLDDPRFSGYASFVARTAEREPGRRLYGDIEFGDLASHTPYWRWSGYHGVSHEWFMFYLASARPEHFRFAESVVWHTVDADTQHWGDAVGSRESEFARAENHTVAGPNSGSIKIWNYGEVDYYFLTGRRRIWEMLVNTARFVMDCNGMVPGSLTNQRATSLPFMHLAYMFQAIGDEKAIAQLFPKSYSRWKRYPARTDSIGVESSVAMLQQLRQVNDHLCKLMATREYCRKTLFFSYAADGFYRYWLLTRDPSSIQGIVDTAEFLYQNMILPTGIPYYAASPPDVPWAPFQPAWDEVDLPATRAYQVTGDRRFLDYGKAPVDTLLNYKGIANLYTGLSSTVPEFLWAMRDAGLTQDDLAQLRPGIDYDRALEETKAIALAKYDITPSSESRAYCILAEEAGRVLINLGRQDDALSWLQHWQKNSQSYDIQPFLSRAQALPLPKNSDSPGAADRPSTP